MRIRGTQALTEALSLDRRTVRKIKRLMGDDFCAMTIHQRRNRSPTLIFYTDHLHLWVERLYYCNGTMHLMQKNTMAKLWNKVAPTARPLEKTDFIASEGRWAFF